MTTCVDTDHLSCPATYFGFAVCGEEALSVYWDTAHQLYIRKPSN